MNLRPLGDRVLIRPEMPDERTDSGLYLAEHRKPEQTGTVVAVGPCAHPRKAEAEDMAKTIESMLSGAGWLEPIYGAADLLRRVTAREPQVKPGDYVVFSWTAGQEIWVEDGEERLLLMRESDILCVVEGLA
jgi:chaperonin GroES